MESLLTWIRHAAPDGRGDSDLLAAFLADHDERAFAEVVRHHGPVVWGVCRRMLPDPSDTEDAFQATFLVLARRGYRPSAPLGPWLYGVAVLTARGVRQRNARRRARQRPLPDDLAAPPAPAPVELDGLLLRMPEKYRVAVLLCYFEGLTEREAAARLGCPVGTLSARVSRGLAWLRERIPSDPRALLVAAAVGAVPAVATAAAVRTAVAVRVSSQVAAGTSLAPIVEGVVQMLWLKNAGRVAAAVLVAAAVGLAVGVAATAVGVDRAGRGVMPAADKSPAGRSGLTAAPRAPVPVEPWRAEFQKVYGLRDGDVLKRVAPPYPECREKWFDAMYADFTRPAPTADNSYLFFRFRDNKVARGTVYLYGAAAATNPPRGKLSFVIESGFRLPMQEVEATGDLLDTDIEGEFVLRDSATPEQWVPALDTVLRTECKIRFTLKEVEREVVVASGVFKSNPRPGQRPGVVVVSTQADGPLEGGSIGTYGEFVVFLNKFVDKRVVSDVKNPPAGQLGWRHTSGTMIRRDGREVYTEDHDPDAVLKGVAEQTGLTFKTEKRKVRVVFVEKVK